jgi:hypothetical protein
MAYATVADVEARLGRSLEAGEQEIVETRLNDVELLIRHKIPDLDAQVADGRINESILVMVEADTVLRLIKNVDGYRSETDGNYSYQIDDRVASGRLDILASEWALLGITSGVFTIRTNLAPYYDNCPPDPWVTL